MLKRLTMTAALMLTSLCFAAQSQAQYGGLQVQVGNYGNGIRVGGFGFGNGLNNGYGYSSGYPYGYRSGYQRGYSNYRQPGYGYRGGLSNSAYGYRGYPSANYSYGATRYYSTPMMRSGPRRYR